MRRNGSNQALVWSLQEQPTSPPAHAADKERRDDQGAAGKARRVQATDTSSLLVCGLGSPIIHHPSSYGPYCTESVAHTHPPPPPPLQPTAHSGSGWASTSCEEHGVVSGMLAAADGTDRLLRASCITSARAQVCFCASRTLIGVVTAVGPSLRQKESLC